MEKNNSNEVKRSFWESQFDKLKLESDQNKKIVQSIFSKMQSQNDSLIEDNKRLREALSNIIDCQFNPNKTLANLNGSIYEAKKLMEDVINPSLRKAESK